MSVLRVDLGGATLLWPLDRDLDDDPQVDELPPFDDGSARCPDCGGSLAPGSHPDEGDCC